MNPAETFGSGDRNERLTLGQPATAESCPSAIYTALVECMHRLREINSSSPAGITAAYAEERVACLLDRIAGNPAQSPDWACLRIGVPAAERFETIRRVVSPMLVHLRESFPIHGWWWMHKRDIFGPALRVRVHVPEGHRSDLERAAGTYVEGCGLETSTLIYEPETCLFGGSDGMGIAHELFCADSEFLSRWLALDARCGRQIIPSGLSFSLIFRFLRSTGLDMFEMWDVFDRVYAKRRRVHDKDEDNLQIEGFAIRIIEAGHTTINSALPESQRDLTERYEIELEALGQKLAKAYWSGKLRCGMREFAAPLILFHWNRVGIGGAMQWALSRAAARVLERQARSRSSS